MGRDYKSLMDETKNDPTMIGVRSNLPLAILEGRGHGDPMDKELNDPTMLRVRENGAPSASRFGPMVPRPATTPMVPAMGPVPMPQGSPPNPLPPMGNRVPTAPTVPLPPMGSRIPGSVMNPPSTGGGLSARGVRPIGRSMREAPVRRLETLARYGSMRAAEALVGLKQAGMQRDFTREMNDVNFQQGMAMNAAQQQAQDARQQQERADRMGMWSAEQAAREKQQADHWQQQLTLYGLNAGEDAMKAERERRQQEADRTRVPMVGTIPVPGTEYVIPTADGRAMGTLPSKQPDPKPPAGLVPQAANINGVHYGPPATKTDKPHIEMMKQPDGSSVPYSVHVDAQGQVIMRKVKIVDANKDGIDDRAQDGGESAAPAAEKPSSFLNF